MALTRPPRIIGSSREDLSALSDWGAQLYAALVEQLRLTRRVPALAAITPFSMTISNPPTKAEVDALVAKVNEIIAAAKI